MSASDPILRRVHACILARVPAILWSPPGGGKTARVLSYASARGMHCERWLASRLEPIDVKPRIYHEGRIIVGTPPELERLRELGGILFADELNRATREVEGALLDVFDNPPPGVAILAACNPPSRGQAARSLESAAANRFCHFDVDVDADAWAAAQIGGWPIVAADFGQPDEVALTEAMTAAATYGSLFIRRRGTDEVLSGGKIAVKGSEVDAKGKRIGTLLDAPPDNPTDAGKPWPSPRTWEYAKRLHAMALALNYDAADTMALVTGCVGSPAATEYMAFVADADLPDPEELLSNPEKYKPQANRVDRTIVALTAVVGALERDFTDARWRAAWKLTHVCADAEHLDASMIAGYLLMEAYGRLKTKDAAKHATMTNPGSSGFMHPRVAKVMTR